MPVPLPQAESGRINSQRSCIKIVCTGVSKTSGILPSRFLRSGGMMLKSELLKALQQELLRHEFCTYIRDGYAEPGCKTCKLRLNTQGQFMEHLCKDVLPAVLDRLAAAL
jgi:hypothetical protein